MTVLRAPELGDASRLGSSLQLGDVLLVRVRQLDQGEGAAQREGGVVQLVQAAGDLDAVEGASDEARLLDRAAGGALLAGVHVDLAGGRVVGADHDGRVAGVRVGQ